MKCGEKVPYDSAMLAANAAWLHRAAHPGCAGVEPYPCADHWHIGHATWWASRDCQADPAPRLRRPARVSGQRRHDRAKAPKRRAG